MVGLLLFFFISIFFSFLCSVLEAVLLSINPSYIRRQQKERPALYKDLREFKKDIDRPLSAILTLNTISHTVGAVGVGIQASKVFSEKSYSILGLGITMEGVIAALMTLAILVLSEIIPKTIGANNWEKLAPRSIWILKILIVLLGPFVWMSQFITKRLKKDKSASVLSRADLEAMAQEVSEDGVLKKSESKVIKNVLNLPNKNIEHIMTPRTVMFSAKSTMLIADLVKEDEFEQFTRVPLFDGEKEKIEGMAHKSDVLKAIVDGKENDSLRSIKRPVSEVNEKMSLASLFNREHHKREHIHIVVDRYGSVTGLVTLEDVLETILGYEIVDETDLVADMQTLIDKRTANDQSGQDDASP